MTYEKIARLANVSTSTVSKALNGSREISDELRKSIIKIATDEDYFAKKGKRKVEYTRDGAITVAVVCPEIISVAYAGEINAIKRELESRGAFLSVYIYDFDKEKLDRIIENITVGNRAEGIILFPSEPIEQEAAIPLIAIGTCTGCCDTVSCDMSAYFSDIVKYLKALGHKDIAFVGERLTASKEKAFGEALSKHGLEYKAENVYIINERFEDIGYAAADEMLKNGSLPSAAVCAYDEIALALIKRLSENGVKVPQDISVVGINDIPMSAYSLIPLTTVRIFEKEQAQIAIKMLYEKIFGTCEAIRHVTIQHKLIERDSTGLKGGVENGSNLYSYNTFMPRSTAPLQQNRKQQCRHRPVLFKVLHLQKPFKRCFGTCFDNTRRQRL